MCYCNDNGYQMKPPWSFNLICNFVRGQIVLRNLKGVITVRVKVRTCNLQFFLMNFYAGLSCCYLDKG